MVAPANLAPYVIEQVQEQEELPPHERIAKFIESHPVTHGVYAGELNNQPDGVYISPNVSLADKEGSSLPMVERIVMQPGAQLGAGDSHHGVVFGRVTMVRGLRAYDTAVAIKGFTAESEKATYEHNCLLAAHARGFDTFQPVALARDGDTSYLITQKRDDIESMDNLNWTISPSNPAYEEEIVPQLEFAASNLARLHSRGIFHGDAQAKNFARSDTGNFVVIDLEDATVAQDTDEQIRLMNGGEDKRDSKAFEDVTHFWYALIHPLGNDTGNVFMQEVDYPTCMAEFEKRFLDPYLKSLEAEMQPDTHRQLEIDELRAAIYDYIAKTS